MNEDREDDELQEFESTWHGLDEGQQRLELRNQIRSIVSSEVEDDARMIRQLTKLKAMVGEEIASGVTTHFNDRLRVGNHVDRASSMEFASIFNQALSDLGLVVSYPSVGFPAKLGVAATPPASRLESWLQLEPVDPASKDPPYRLPRSFERFQVIPTPNPPQRRSARAL